MTLRDWQEEQLFILIRAATNSRFGKKHRFSQLQRYEDFAKQVPICFYKDISDSIGELKRGATDIFWPDSITKFSVSAGTTGNGKHLPLTRQRLGADRRFMQKVAWDYLRQRPNLLKLWGDYISLAGTLENHSGIEIGEISAFTALQAPWWLSSFQLVPGRELVRLPFSKKIDRIIRESINKDIRVITAVPSWILTIFQQVLKRTGATCIAEVWPNLQLLVCGGVKLENYRPLLSELLNKTDVDFIETYGASEGYFSYTDDLNRDDMKLVFDNGIFYEFIPNPLPDPNSLMIQEAVPLWDIEPNTPYAMIVSTNAGLWRYAMNDIITFTQTDPPRIKVRGRVSEMLDDYGEALYIYEAEEALHEAAESYKIEMGTFAIAAEVSDPPGIPRHSWFIQTYDSLHADTLKKLARKVDKILRDRNRHYAIRRESEALDMPQFYTITQQEINSWLALNNKQKAQGKLPHILKDEKDIAFFR